MNYVLFMLFVLGSVKHFSQLLWKAFCGIIHYLQLRITPGKQCKFEIYQNTGEQKSHSHETKVHAILYFKHARKANSLPSHLEASSCIQITRKTASHYSSMHSILSQQA